MINKEILDVLACPKCKGPVKYETRKEKIICNKCRLAYGIVDKRIPNMMINEAEKF